MKERAKGFVKTIEKPGRRAVVASNMSVAEIGIKGALAILAALRVLLFGVQALHGVAVNMQNRRRLMADIRRKRK